MNYYFQKHEGLEEFGARVSRPRGYNEGLSKITEPVFSPGRYASLLSRIYQLEDSKRN